MKSFDEFFKENFEYGLSSPAKNIIKFTFEAGQQSKQAEVDELRKRIDDALDVIYKEKSAVECDNYKGADADLIIGVGYELHKILKGDQS